MRFARGVWALILVSFFAFPVWAGKSCYNIFATDGLKSDAYIKLRENNRATWKFVKFKNSLIPKKFRAEGQVVGDPHIKNFAWVYSAKYNGFYLIDYDDVGQAPFWGDVLRLLVTSQTAAPEMSLKPFVKAYAEGLRGEAYPAPRVLAKMEGKRSKYFEGKHLKMLRELTVKMKQLKFPGLKDIQVIPATLPEIQNLFSEVKDDFLEDLSAEFVSDIEALDFAYRTRDIGGSKFLPRFWVLVRGPFVNDYEIFEYKQLARPSTDEFQDQGDSIARVEAAIKLFSNKKVDVRFSPLKTAPMDFWRKPVEPDYLDLADLFINKPKERVDVINYIAYYLGRLHSASAPKKYISAVIGDRAEFADLIQSLADEFLGGD